MNCREAQSQVADYSTGLLEGESKQRLQQHLAGCWQCQEHLAQLRALDRLLAGEPLQADEALVQRIMAQVKEVEIFRKLRRRFLLEGLAPIFVVLGLAAGVIVVLHPQVSDWAKALSTWQVDWELLAQPERALPLILGLPLIAGLAIWLTNQLAKALT